MIQFLIGVAVFLIIAPILLIIPFLIFGGLLSWSWQWTLAGLVLAGIAAGVWERIQYGGSRRY